MVEQNRRAIPLTHPVRTCIKMKYCWLILAGLNISSTWDIWSIEVVLRERIRTEEVLKGKLGDSQSSRRRLRLRFMLQHQA